MNSVCVYIYIYIYIYAHTCTYIQQSHTRTYADSSLHSDTYADRCV